MLENDQILLRSLEISDVSLLYSWENKRENWKVSHTVTPYSMHVLTDYINAVSDIYTDKQLRLVIISKDSEAALGSVDLFDCDFKNKRAGIGILIADSQNRGKGIASQVLELLVEYTSKVLDLHQIYCNVLCNNSESIALFKKFGFETIGIKKDWTFYAGAFYDELLMQKILLNGH